MLNIIYKLLFLFSISLLTSCISDGYTSKPRPITITSKKAKQIQSVRFRPHEAKRFDNHLVRWDMIAVNKRRKYSPMESKRFSVNNNSKNRNNNRQIVKNKRKQDSNYKYYRDAMEVNQQAERSNFSIYDK